MRERSRPAWAIHRNAPAGAETGRAWLAMAAREWSSRMSSISTSVIGQPPVGDIGLPQLVWHLGFPHCGVSVIVSQDMGIPLQDESDVGVPRFAR